MGSALGNIQVPYRGEREISLLRVNEIRIGDGAPIAGKPELYTSFFDDFNKNFASGAGDGWDTFGGSATRADEKGGAVMLNTLATDNDEEYLADEFATSIFNTTSKLWFEARVRLTEANTDDANIILGLSDFGAADGLLQDDGAGPAASYDGAVFYKVDGGTDWNFQVSNAAVQGTSLNMVARNDGEYEILGFRYDPQDGVTGRITPFINGTAYPSRTITIAGLDLMHIVFGVMAGDANVEELYVDYVTVIQER